MAPLFVRSILSIAFVLLACGNAGAAALVGETSLVQIAPAAATAPEQRKAEYRQPGTIPFPADNPYTPEKAYLGRVLFHDTRLSGSGMLSCASCHNRGFGYSDGLARSATDGAWPSARRSPGIVNSAWGKLFTWDGRASSLEEQVLIPLQAPSEMNQTLDKLIRILSEIPEYKALFAAAFRDQSINQGNVAAAIATYERTIVSASSKFDAWLEGNEAAMSAAAKRGFDLFNNKARCASCHGGWLFTDDGFYDIGLPGNDMGRGPMLPEVVKVQHAFKTPGLREVAQRGPYMHDGSLPTLEAVVDHYNKGGVERPSRSALIAPLNLLAEEQADLVAYLRALSSPVRPHIVPLMPR